MVSQSNCWCVCDFGHFWPRWLSQSPTRLEFHSLARAKHNENTMKTLCGFIFHSIRYSLDHFFPTWEGFFLPPFLPSLAHTHTHKFDFGGKKFVFFSFWKIRRQKSLPRPLDQLALWSNTWIKKQCDRQTASRLVKIIDTFDWSSGVSPFCMLSSDSASFKSKAKQTVCRCCRIFGLLFDPKGDNMLMWWPGQSVSLVGRNSDADLCVFFTTCVAALTPTFVITTAYMMTRDQLQTHTHTHTHIDSAVESFDKTCSRRPAAFFG